MELITIDKPVQVFCVTAASFPAGVMAAHQRIHELAPETARRFYGISHPEQGVITYKAAASELHDGEATEMGCEPFTIPSGKYYSITILDFMKQLPAIGQAFQAMLAEPGIDPNGYCIEQYLNDIDVQCMVRRAK